MNQSTREQTDNEPRVLRGYHAVVTGASSGIGRAISLAFAAAGCEQVLVHFNRNRVSADETASRVKAFGSQALLDQCDFADADAATAFVDRAFEKMPRIDTWVHCAGADVLTGDAASWSFEQKLQRLIDVDLLGSILAGRAVGTRMRDQSQAALGQARNDSLEPVVSPALLFIGWDQATEGMEGDAGQMFSPVKAGIEAFGKSLAQELAPHVRVNTLAPGWIKTAWGATTSDYWNQRALDQSLMARWGRPEDVAAAAVFLASPAGSFISGHTLPINGGWSRRYDRREA